MIKINVPIQSKRQRIRMQLALVHNILHDQRTKEIKVLEYLLRHSAGGMYKANRGYRSDIAKYIGSTNNAVKMILKRLSSKKLITNNTGSNLGVYTFHPAVTAVYGNQNTIAFTFVEK